jgi:hypothetical protein
VILSHGRLAARTLRRPAMSRLRDALEFLTAAFRRPRVIALLVFSAVLAAATSADAGIVTSIDATACGLPKSLSPTNRNGDSRLHLTLRLLWERTPGFNQGLPTSVPSTTGGAPGPTSGTAQSLVAFAVVVDCQDLPARGWIAPEGTLALPPLLSSGLFRPPRLW